ncbi:MAG: hypothetical protein HWN66_00400 [Candidatus Helarchaeota archaeon]|nr:hypothetical protein [Candidatus Helarchaeota archaeon]
MSYPKVELKRGLAGLMWKIFKILNDNDEFKEEFADIKLTMLMNPKDQRVAAIIKINRGAINIEDIENDKETIKEVKIDALFEASTETFVDMFTTGLSILGILWKLITRKVKIRGMRKMMALKKIVEILGI